MCEKCVEAAKAELKDNLKRVPENLIETFDKYAVELLALVQKIQDELDHRFIASGPIVDGVVTEFDLTNEADRQQKANVDHLQLYATLTGLAGYMSFRWAQNENQEAMLGMMLPLVLKDSAQIGHTLRQLQQLEAQ